MGAVFIAKVWNCCTLESTLERDERFYARVFMRTAELGWTQKKQIVVSIKVDSTHSRHAAPAWTAKMEPPKKVRFFWSPCVTFAWSRALPPRRSQDEEAEFQTGPLSVLTQSVKANTQARVHLFFIIINISRKNSSAAIPFIQTSAAVASVTGVCNCHAEIFACCEFRVSFLPAAGGSCSKSCTLPISALPWP